MAHLLKIWKFGFPYIIRYKSRFVLALVLGLMFGLTNASFIWVSKTLISRMEPQSETASVEAVSGEAAATSTFGEFTDRLKQRASAFVEPVVDTWLPRSGRELDWRQITGSLLFLPLFVAARGYIGFLANYCLAWVGENVVHDLRMSIIDKLHELSLDYFGRTKMGDRLVNLQADTAAIQYCLTHTFSDLIKHPASFVAIIGALLLMNLKLTAMVVAVVPICIIPILILGRKVKKAVAATREAGVNQASLFMEAFSEVRTVKAFSLEERHRGIFHAFSRQVVHHQLKALRALRLINPTVETITMLGLGVLIITIFQSGIKLSDLVGFLTGVVLLFEPVKKLGNVHGMVQKASVGAERIMTLFQQDPGVREPDKPLPLNGFQQELKLENVTFTYESEPVIDGLSLTIPAGAKIGIAGESGCGKSTIMNLLLRFYDPNSGRITIDGTDLRDVRSGDLRGLIALVSQESSAFNMTLAENIACGRPDASRADIEAAARMANADGFINELPLGYDTMIGERGVNLSGGQRQRLSIARAFVRNAPILLLDEATASLDSHAEAEVQKTLESLEQNRTVVCIAHRLSTLAGMDKIIVLQRGKIVETGTYSELLAANGPFASMATRQGIVVDRTD